MSSDIHQMGGFYDATTQQNAFKAMSQMWQMDQYQQGYAMKDVPNTPVRRNAPVCIAFHEALTSATLPGFVLYAQVTPAIQSSLQQSTSLPHPFANFAQQLSSITQTMKEAPSIPKKKPNPVPVELKDEAYYERRKRNNESARRSREARRQKEDVNFRKLELVQQDNIRLKAELQRVLMELERLKYMAAVQGVQL
uniref:BZIP domain-containing protein n=1 Tax=Angiostrongylus cantonensis TaxID=6313 RepID=A0A158P9D9_ANGCA